MPVHGKARIQSTRSQRGMTFWLNVLTPTCPRKQPRSSGGARVRSVQQSQEARAMRRPNLSISSAGCAAVVFAITDGWTAKPIRAPAVEGPEACLSSGFPDILPSADNGSAPPAITPPIPARIRQERISSRERNLAISASNWRPDRSHRSPCGRYNRMRRRSAVTSSG